MNVASEVHATYPCRFFTKPEHNALNIWPSPKLLWSKLVTEAFCSGMCLSPRSVGTITKEEPPSLLSPNSVTFSHTLAVSVNLLSWYFEILEFVENSNFVKLTLWYTESKIQSPLLQHFNERGQNITSIQGGTHCKIPPIEIDKIC